MDRLTRWFRKADLDCEEVRKLSSDFLDESLPPSRLEKFRAHINGCAPCRSFVDSLGSMLGMLNRLPGVPSPSSLKQSIVDRVDKEGGRKLGGR